MDAAQMKGALTKVTAVATMILAACASSAPADQHYAAAVRNNFLRGCEVNHSRAVYNACSCVLLTSEQKFGEEQFVRIDTNARLHKPLPREFSDIVNQCISKTVLDTAKQKRTMR